jgi:hypothetical protein
MARANMEGRKTETSRSNLKGIKPGDWFYQKEAFRQVFAPGTDILNGFDYRALHIIPLGRWKPSLHMPASAARFWGEVVEVREPYLLQDRTEESCIAEGFTSLLSFADYVAKLKKIPFHEALNLQMAAIIYRPHFTAPEWWPEYLDGVERRKKKKVGP